MNADCPSCRLPFVKSRKDKRYCSKRCYKVAWDSANTKRRPKRVRVRSLEGHCAFCGLYFHRMSLSGKGKDAGRYCSRDCYANKRLALSNEREALSRIRDKWLWTPSPLVVRECAALRRIARYIEKPYRTMRPCAKCGTATFGTMEHSRTCSVCKANRPKYRGPGYKKQRRIDKARRRAIERGSSADRIDPIQVFDRDGWTCYLCGRATPRDKRGSYDHDAPELDHVIPLAKGGTHTWSNVKCCCRRCNGRKGATIRGGEV